MRNMPGRCRGCLARRRPRALLNSDEAAATEYTDADLRDTPAILAEAAGGRLETLKRSARSVLKYRLLAECELSP